jgi:hypothetical protein
LSGAKREYTTVPNCINWLFVATQLLEPERGGLLRGKFEAVRKLAAQQYKDCKASAAHRLADQKAIHERTKAALTLPIESPSFNPPS